MTGAKLYTVARKELLLLSRDLHGLLLLFVMPLVFILVMSLAMQDHYASRSGAPLQVMVVDHANSATAAELVATMQRNQGYHFAVVPPGEHEAALDAARRGNIDLLIEILPELNAFAELQESENITDQEPVVVMKLPAHTSRQQEHIFAGLLQEALGRLRLTTLFETLNAQDLGISLPNEEEMMGASAISTTYLYGNDPANAPSSVQQNVPAWLIFSIFFIVVPLSYTFIQERQLGTLYRMRSMRVSPATLMLGKCVPYFGVNQIQVALMLLAGVFLVPLLGGDQLQLGTNWGSLIIMSAAVSWAALGYALLIAVVARTPEQAVTLGGMGNIIWAAIGGIMVPAFIMPPRMQMLSHLSPMAWALEGFLDVLLRNGGWTMIRDNVGLLGLFGLACMTGAMYVYARMR